MLVCCSKTCFCSGKRWNILVAVRLGMVASQRFLTVKFFFLLYNSNFIINTPICEDKKQVLTKYQESCQEWEIIFFFEVYILIYLLLYFLQSLHS